MYFLKAKIMLELACVISVFEGNIKQKQNKPQTTNRRDIGARFDSRTVTLD
jgi:hypothetical protein